MEYEYNYVIKAKNDFIPDWYENRKKRVELELIIHPEISPDINKNKILKIIGDLDAIYPIKPLKNFTGTLEDWHSIMEKLSVKERHFFLENTIGFQGWAVDLQKLMDKGYSIELVPIESFTTEEIQQFL